MKTLKKQPQAKILNSKQQNEKSKTKEACDPSRSSLQRQESVEVCEPPDVRYEEKSALEIWKQALDNITPQVEVKSRRIGGATFQVPTEIRPDRKESISMKNMIAFARKRSGKSMADKLAAEIMDAFNNQGGAFKRKEDMHRMAEANRAFAHFRF